MPPPPMSWHVDSRHGLVVVTVSGALDAAAGSALSRMVMHFLAREPVAVLVELSGMTVTEPGAARIFPELLVQAEVWPGTPVQLCAPGPATAALLTHGPAGSVPLFPSVADGLAALSGRDELISEHIGAAAGAARRARDVVTEACLRWNLPHLTAPATLAASELVTNAVEHAHTGATLQVRLRPRHLYVAAFDGAQTEPVPGDGHDPGAAGGRGLYLIDLVSTRWGHLRRSDGKVVWASFATAPAGDLSGYAALGPSSRGR